MKSQPQTMYIFALHVRLSFLPSLRQSVICGWLGTFRPGIMKSAGEIPSFLLIDASDHEWLNKKGR
jgi:hypothetical protein